MLAHNPKVTSFLIMIFFFHIYLVCFHSDFDILTRYHLMSFILNKITSHLKNNRFLICVFLWIFLVKLSCQRTKSAKPMCFHDFFQPNNFCNFYVKSKLSNPKLGKRKIVVFWRFFWLCLSYLQNITCYIMQNGYEVKVDLVVHFVAMKHFFQEVMNLVSWKFDGRLSSAFIELFFSKTFC